MPVTQALTDRKEASTTTAAVPEGRTRLHITPFNPDLLERFIPPSVLPQATGISYHSIQTFPEKGYGYVEIPTMEAQKLKGKLNGSILKGTKVRIEDARPEKRKRLLEEQAESAGVEVKAGKKVKKVKGDRKKGIIPGFELPNERHVKRGWTEPENHSRERRKEKKDKKEQKKAQQKSQYTTEPELLFRTKLPPNTVPTSTSKPEKSAEKSKKSKSSRDVVVHEFSKTTKHASFLKGTQITKDSKHAAEYVEGKGWVDEEGNVVEPESEQLHKRRAAKERAETERRRAAQFAASADADTKVDSSGKSSAQKISAALEAKRKPVKAVSPPLDASESDEEEESDDESSIVSTSSSDVSTSEDEESESSEEDSEDESEDESEEVSSSEAESDVTNSTAQEASTQVASAADVNMADAPGKPQELEEPKEVHPLEALFKRQKVPDGEEGPKLAINTSFNFFGGGDDENEEEAGMNPPHTPFTRQDLQVRGVRSAAPTPDTAAIGKKFTWRDEEEDEDEDEEDYEGSYMQDANTVTLGVRAGAADGTPGEEQSEFAKHFWENRGEYNRAWKKRRRESLKVKRQRENRRLGRRVV